MIPINEIVKSNLYCQDDAQFLLGAGFTKRAAKELICESCRTGDLPNHFHRKRYWFTGEDFLGWVRSWAGGSPSDSLADSDRLLQNDSDDNRLGAASEGGKHEAV